MEIKITKENFLKRLILAEKLTGKNLNLPILSFLLLSTQKGKIKISATNLDIGFEIFIPAKIEIEGSVVVPAKILTNAILNLKEDIISLKQENFNNLEKHQNNENLKIITENSIILIKTGNIDDFPILPKIKKEKSFKLKISLFLKGLKIVFFSASLSYFKPEIASIYFFINKNNIIFTATDSFRLAEKKILYENVNNLIDFKETSFLIPLKTAAELIHILEEIQKEEDIEIEINFNRNEFTVSNDIFTFYSRLTEGQFPDYKQFIPTKFLGEIKAETSEILNILKTSNIFLSRLSDIVLEINLHEQIIEFKTANSDIGEYSSKLKIFKNGFNENKTSVLKITFNLKYLLEGISKIDSKQIIFKISEEGKPVIIQGDNDKNFLYLVMPMKL